MYTHGQRVFLLLPFGPPDPEARPCATAGLRASLLLTSTQGSACRAGVPPRTGNNNNNNTIMCACAITQVVEQYIHTRRTYWVFRAEQTPHSASHAHVFTHPSVYKLSPRMTLILQLSQNNAHRRRRRPFANKTDPPKIRRTDLQGSSRFLHVGLDDLRLARQKLPQSLCGKPFFFYERHGLAF